MKKLFALLVCLALALSAVLSGCSEKSDIIAPELLPKPANDPAVREELGNYRILVSVPVYAYSGIFGGVTSTTGDAATLQYMGVTAEDYRAYAESFEEAGWLLSEGSKIWLTEGWMGMPQYVKNGILVTLSWSVMDGNLNISVAYS